MVVTVSRSLGILATQWTFFISSATRSLNRWTSRCTFSLPLWFSSGSARISLIIGSCSDMSPPDRLDERGLVFLRREITLADTWPHDYADSDLRLLRRFH